MPPDPVHALVSVLLGDRGPLKEAKEESTHVSTVVKGGVLLLLHLSAVMGHLNTDTCNCSICVCVGDQDAATDVGGRSRRRAKTKAKKSSSHVRSMAPPVQTGRRRRRGKKRRKERKSLSLSLSLRLFPPPAAPLSIRPPSSFLPSFGGDGGRQASKGAVSSSSPSLFRPLITRGHLVGRGGITDDRHFIPNPHPIR